MTPPTVDVRSAALQELESLRLLGVDFLPMTARECEVPPLSSGPNGGAAAESATAGAGREQCRAALALVEQRHAAACPICTQAAGIRRLVFGEGDPVARLMFIGEAPGEEEDRTGRPFVGRAGQKLGEIITAMGLSRDEVYIANILKSRPPENRTPLQHEVEGCGPFLHEQIALIRPRVIVALGGPSAKYLLGVETGITRLRGRWATYQGGDLTIPVMPTFHPAYLLRNYTRETREQVWSDMQAVIAALK